MSNHKTVKRSFVYLGISIVSTLVLAGCSGSSLNDENAKSRMMTNDDFPFPVELQVDGYEIEQEDYPVFYWNEEECISDLQLAKLIDEGSVVAERTFYEPEDSDEEQWIYFYQGLIEFPETEQANEFIQLVKEGLDDISCTVSEPSDEERREIIETGTTQSILGVGGDNSAAYLQLYTSNFDGPSVSMDYYDSYTAIKNYVLVTSGTVESGTGSVTSNEMKEVMKQSIAKIIG